MTPEGIVQDYLKKRVKATGGTFRKVRWIARRAAPDCLVWWPGIHAFAECKRLKGQLEVLQVREIARLREGGFKVFTPHSKEEVDQMLEELGVGRVG